MRARLTFSLLAGVMGALLGATAAPAGGMSRICQVPDALLTFDAELKRIEELIDRSAPVRILRIRPSLERLARPVPARTLAGKPDLRPLAATVSFDSELRRRLPDVPFTIIDERPLPGDARDDFEQIRTMIDTTDPDLVIWQVGTGDAMAATDPEDFAHTLEEAADWIEDRDVDLVLVDPPFVPNVPHERRYAQIVRQIDAISGRDKMNVVSQYDATRYLLSQLQAGGREDAGTLCIPELMAEAIVRAATR